MTRKEVIDYLQDARSALPYKFGEAIDIAIESLSTDAEAEWIPCSERLPSEKDGRVLVTERDEIRIVTYSEFSGTWYLGEMCAVGGEDPIAWMPLPKPYVGSEVKK